MAASAQIPLTTARVMRRWKWSFGGLAAVVAIVALFVVFDRYNGGTIIPFFFAELIVLAGAARARRFERILGRASIAERIARYAALRKGSFTAACAGLEEDGHLRKFGRVIMASPSTWGRRQGIAHFECDPFEILLYEKNGRVGAMTVFVSDDEKG